MEQSNLRKPKQKRAIAKKQKIMENGFILMCEKGYHNVDCAEIAQNSGVSTGTVYQYFTDKRDIFLQGLKSYSRQLLFPIFDYENKKIKFNDISTLIKKIIKNAIKTHSISSNAHEEILAMKHSDDEVNNIFKEFELEATETLVKILKNNNFDTNDIYEKSHLIITWVDDLCHEIVYHKHDNLNYDKMIEIVINSIVGLLK